MKTRVLRYFRKIQLLYCSSISSNPHPKSPQYEGGSRALGERKEFTEGHTNAMASRRKHIQPFAKKNFRSWNKISSPSTDIQVSNSKVHLHNTYYAALFLLQRSSSWTHKPLRLCCHDLFYCPETPSKREPFICSLTSDGLYLFHTKAHRNGVAQTELCDSPVSSVILISVFLHLHACHGPTISSLMLCTVAAGGSPSDFTFLVFSQQLLMTEVIVFTQAANTEPRYTEVQDLFNKKARANLTYWLKTLLTV